jgi:4-hydroxybutyrate CoA-transferase
VRIVSAAEAVSVIQSGNRVFIHSVAAAPRRLIEAMTARSGELRVVEIVQLHTEGEAPYAAPEMARSFRVNSVFVGANIRDAVQDGRADYLPIFLSEVPKLFRSGLLPLDVALVQVSPPDRHGFCSLGVSVDATRSAVQTARTVIAQVNRKMPRTHGDGLIHVDDIEFGVEGDDPIPEVRHPPVSEIDRAVGRHCAELVEDGATLQIGIGTIPDATLAALGDHHRLGIHTEMLSDGIVDLVEKGVVTGEKKRFHPGKIVAGFALGTRRLYDFMDDNPLVQMLDIGYVNDPEVIRRNPRVTAINSALEVDITGQVCADSIGELLYSGVGGQMDFIRAAALSEGGKPIIALPSVTSSGESRVVSQLKPGAGVVTTRAHVHFVVTEHGIADLFGSAPRRSSRSPTRVTATHSPRRHDAGSGAGEARLSDPGASGAGRLAPVVDDHRPGQQVVQGPAAFGDEHHQETYAERHHAQRDGQEALQGRDRTHLAPVRPEQPQSQERHPRRLSGGGPEQDVVESREPDGGQRDHVWNEVAEVTAHLPPRLSRGAANGVDGQELLHQPAGAPHEDRQERHVHDARCSAAHQAGVPGRHDLPSLR